MTYEVYHTLLKIARVLTCVILNEMKNLHNAMFFPFAKYVISTKAEGRVERSQNSILIHSNRNNIRSTSARGRGAKPRN